MPLALGGFELNDLCQIVESPKPLFYFSRVLIRSVNMGKFDFTKMSWSQDAQKEGLIRLFTS